jgi:hypothetical protein
MVMILRFGAILIQIILYIVAIRSAKSSSKISRFVPQQPSAD